MFRFTHVLDATTGDRYCITAARLMDETFDAAPDAVNLYEIDLCGEDEEGRLISNISLSIHNSGCPVCLTRDLSPERAREKKDGAWNEALAEVYPVGTTLVAATTRRVDQTALLRLMDTHPDSAEEAAGMTKALRAVMTAEHCTAEEVEEMEGIMQQMYLRVERMQELDFDKWTPDEAQKDRFLNYFFAFYSNMRETCGEEADETEEALELYERVKANALVDMRDEIQDHFLEMYLSVGGRPKAYYDQETVDLINQTLCPSPVQEKS